MSRTMLVTGATGVVGRDLLGRALESGWDAVGASSRGGDGVVAWAMGTDPAPAELRRHWDVVVHAAARPKWNLDADVAWAANVGTIDALTDVVGPGTHLVHVSTAYATGLGGVDVTSTDLADYRNTYEWSKAASERAVAERFDQVTVVRPPLVVGARADGAVARFTGLYVIVRAALAGMLPVIVGEPHAAIEVVSTTDVTDCVLAVSGRGTGGPTEIVGGSPLSPAGLLDHMFAGLNDWRTAHGGDTFPTPQVITPDQWHRFYLPFARPHMTGRQRHFTDLLAEFLPYLAIPEPLAPTWPIEPVGPCVRRSVATWAATFPRLALNTPAPWVGVDDDEGVA